jgi:hypothetical protein
MNPNVPDLFISCNVEELAWVEKAIRTLEAKLEILENSQLRPFRCFVYKHDITAGEDWHDRTLVNAVSALRFLFVISPQALASDWCHLELHERITRHPHGLDSLLFVNRKEGLDANEAQTGVLTRFRRWVDVSDARPFEKQIDELTAWLCRKKEYEGFQIIRKANKANRFVDHKLPVLLLQLADVRIRETSLPGQLSARLEIQLRLPIDSKPFEHARRVRKSQAAIARNLEAITRIWFRGSCTLEQFCFARDDLCRGLETVVRSYAEGELYMELDSLTVQCEVPFPKDLQVRSEYRSKGVVQPGNYGLIVNHQLVVRRVDLGRFYTDGPRPATIGATEQEIQERWNGAFEEWIDDLLKRVTSLTFFGKTYLEVSLHFKEICATLKDEVHEEFKRIGFTVRQLISLPEDPQVTSILERKFTFDTGAIHCKTREAKVDYGISAHVVLEFNSLREIEKYLRPGQGLQNQFIHVATVAVRNTVRTLDPEKLYTKFAIPDPETGMPSPEGQIVTALKIALTENFDAIENTMSITLTPEPTEVTRLFDELRPFESHRCPVVVETRDLLGEHLSFFVDYRVEAIAHEGWPKFLEQCRKNLGKDTAEKAKKMFEAIDNAFRSRAATGLVRLSSTPLTSPHQDLQKVITALGIAEAMQEISDYLGLSIRIMNVRPQPRKWTECERQRELDFYEAARLDYHAASAQHRDRQRQYQAGDPRLEESRQRVEECERKLRGFGTRHDEYFKDAPTLLSLDWENILYLRAGEDKTESETSSSKADAEKPESNG